VTGIVIVPLRCQDIPGSHEPWSTPLHANGRDGKPEMGKGWCRLSIKLLSQRQWRAVAQISSGEYTTSYLLKLWENREHFYKNRWECTTMGKKFSSLNSLSSF